VGAGLVRRRRIWIASSRSSIILANGSQYCTYPKWPQECGDDLFVTELPGLEQGWNNACISVCSFNAIGLL